MARVAAFDHGLVRGDESNAVFLFDRRFHVGEAAGVDGVEDALDVDIRPVLGANGGRLARQPDDVAAHLVELILRELPVLLLGREPEIGPVELHVHHDVRVRRHDRLQLRDVRGQALQGRRRCCVASLLRSDGGNDGAHVPSTIGRNTQKDSTRHE